MTRDEIQLKNHKCVTRDNECVTRDNECVTRDNTSAQEGGRTPF